MGLSIDEIRALGGGDRRELRSAFGRSKMSPNQVSTADALADLVALLETSVLRGDEMSYATVQRG